jgi:hypothetical protein
VSTSQNPGRNCNIKILDKPFENVEKLKYMGTRVLIEIALRETLREN